MVKIKMFELHSVIEGIRGRAHVVDGHINCKLFWGDSLVIPVKFAMYMYFNVVIPLLGNYSRNVLVTVHSRYLF